MQVFEAVVPPTTYGYWVTDDGTIIPVRPFDHDAVLTTMNFENPFSPNCYSVAYKRGWIRVVTKVPMRNRPPMDVLWVDFITPSTKALRSLRYIYISAADKAKNFRLDSADLPEDKFWQKIREATTLETTNAIADVELTETVVLDSNYGYWVTNTGAIIPVGYCKHASVLAELGKTRACPATPNEAIHSGWIRVVINTTPHLNTKEHILWINISNPTKAAVSSLKELSKTLFDVDDLRINNTMFHSESEFWRYLYKKTLSESVIPESKYGYWITDKGEYIPVGLMQHTEVLETLPTPPHTYSEAYRKGWIRVVGFDGDGDIGAEVDTTWGKPSNSALRALFKLASSISVEEYTYTNSAVGSKYLSIRTNERSKWLRYIKNNLEIAELVETRSLFWDIVHKF